VYGLATGEANRMTDELARVRGRVDVVPARIVDREQIRAELGAVKAEIRSAFLRANPPGRRPTCRA
jgi:hypothetical protein